MTYFRSVGYLVLTISLTLLAAAASSPVAPSAPTPLVHLRAGSELFVDITPPSTDGGSEITSYLVDWDTNPGTREVQTVTTGVYLGPNEVQERRGTEFLGASSPDPHSVGL